MDTIREYVHERTYDVMEPDPTACWVLDSDTDPRVDGLAEVIRQWLDDMEIDADVYTPTEHDIDTLVSDAREAVPMTDAEVARLIDIGGDAVREAVEGIERYHEDEDERQASIRPEDARDWYGEHRDAVLDGRYRGRTPSGEESPHTTRRIQR